MKMKKQLTTDKCFETTHLGALRESENHFGQEYNGFKPTIRFDTLIAGKKPYVYGSGDYEDRYSSVVLKLADWIELQYSGHNNGRKAVERSLQLDRNSKVYNELRRDYPEWEPQLAV